MHGFPCTCVPCQTASEGFRAWETLSDVDSLSSLSCSVKNPILEVARILSLVYSWLPPRVSRNFIEQKVLVRVFDTPRKLL